MISIKITSPFIHSNSNNWPLIKTHYKSKRVQSTRSSIAIRPHSCPLPRSVPIHCNRALSHPHPDYMRIHISCRNSVFPFSPPLICILYGSHFVTLIWIPAPPALLIRARLICSHAFLILCISCSVLIVTIIWSCDDTSADTFWKEEVTDVVRWSLGDLVGILARYMLTYARHVGRCD